MTSSNPLLKKTIEDARKKLDISEPKESLKLLKPLIKSNKYNDNIFFLQILGEIYLELNKPEKSYNYFIEASNLDKDGEIGGYEKFLWLGQLTGGKVGLNWFDKGAQLLTKQLNLIENELENIEENGNENEEEIEEKLNLLDSIKQKLSETIFSVIEIWMTDLCMEPEAESQCDKLINEAIEIDRNNPESWSLLSSIRISQQKDENAIEALKTSWELFQKRRQSLLVETQHNNNNDDNEIEISSNTGLLVQPLLTLNRISIELKQFEIAIKISQMIEDIDDQVLDSFYLEGFANYLQAQLIQNNGILPDQESLNGNNFPLIIGDNENHFTTDSRNALLSAKQLLTIDEVASEADPDIVNHIEELLTILKSDEYLNSIENNKAEEDDDDENAWENEIESDDEDVEMK